MAEVAIQTEFKIPDVNLRMSVAMEANLAPGKVRRQCCRLAYLMEVAAGERWEGRRRRRLCHGI